MMNETVTKQRKNMRLSGRRGAYRMAARRFKVDTLADVSSGSVRREVAVMTGGGEKGRRWRKAAAAWAGRRGERMGKMLNWEREERARENAWWYWKKI
jgi:hypothetical protein